MNAIQQTMNKLRGFKSCHLEADWSLDASGEVPKFAMTPAYNGGKLRVRGFDAPVIVDLSSASFEKPNIKINANHDPKDIVGHAQDQEINAKGIFVSGLLSKVSETVTRIVQESKNAYPHEASIEATFPKPELVPAGRSATVNGTVQAGPFYVARNAVITGVAILDTGADRATEVSIAAENLLIDEDIMSSELKAFLAENNLDLESVTVDQLRAAMPTPKPKKDEKPDPVDADLVTPEELRQQAIKAAYEAEAQAAEHIAGIKAICAEYDHPQISVTGEDGQETTVNLQTHAIRQQWSLDRTKMEAMHHRLQKQNGGNSFAIHDSTSHDGDFEVMECALALSTGKINDADLNREKFYDEKTIDLAKSKRFRGLRPSGLALQFIQAAGMHCRPGQLDEQFIETVVSAHRKLQASGFTTASFPGIMRNVANKTLLAAYTRAPTFIPFVFGRSSSTDFKVAYTYQYEGSGMLEKLGNDGQIKHGKVIENEYTKQIEQYAKMLAWTRKEMINDDLGALGRTANQLGVMAFKAREFAATQFLVSPAAGFYASGNKNLVTTNAFSVDGMTKSTTSFMAQTDSDGLPISVGADRVLLPSALAVRGQQVMNDTEVRVGTSTNRVELISNPHAGTFSALATAWLDNAIANPSDAARATTWYRFADPGIVPALEVVYLNGRDTPVIESDETDFNTLGMQFRAVFDFGFGANDPRYAQKNTA